MIPGPGDPSPGDWLAAILVALLLLAALVVVVVGFVRAVV